MIYNVAIEGFEGQNIEINVNFWTGTKLLVNGEAAPKGEKRNQMVLQRNDGRQVIAEWKPQLLGFDVPHLVVDGKAHNVVEPLKWYQWVWGGWPLLLVFMGGALGAIAGMIGFTLNAKLFRTDMHPVLKYIATGATAFLSVLAYLIVATVISLLLQK